MARGLRQWYVQYIKSAKQNKYEAYFYNKHMQQNCIDSFNSNKNKRYLAPT